jgi:hypothetical protein
MHVNGRRHLGPKSSLISDNGYRILKGPSCIAYISIYCGSNDCNSADELSGEST